MSIELEQSSLAPRITSLLSAVPRIRSYIWTEGLAAIVVALGIAFWFSVAFDWLFEPPWQFRLFMLVAIGAATVYVANRFLFRRAFQPLQDEELAVLLERRFRNYRDSLLTTVEMDSHPKHAAAFNQQMLGHTRRQAVEESEAIRLGDVFRFAPLLRTLSFAAALAVSALGFAVFAPEAFGTWVNRVVFLDRDLLWPRRNHVRVQDFPEDHVKKVAKGSDFEVTALADLSGRFRLPDAVQIRYRTGEGTKGRDNMSTVGAASSRDREQKYAYMFKGIMSSIDFDVYGGDDRDRAFRLEVVDNPTLSKVELECEYPEYTGRPNNTVPASALVQLPQGTKVKIRCESNKDLEQVPVTMVRGDKASTLAEVQLTGADRRHFTVDLPALMEDTTLLFDLHDADGIRSREPVKLVLAARADDLPAVALRLRGISTAITPQAKLPAVGEVHDDYGLARLWFEYQLEKPTAKKAMPAPAASTADAAAESTGEQNFRADLIARDGKPRTQVNVESADDEALDLKRERALGELLARNAVKTLSDLSRITSTDEKQLVADVKSQKQIDQAIGFAPQIGGKLFVTLRAADNCALPAGANVGQGERYQLDIVSAEQLASMLEGRELMQRRRFETNQEMQETRDALAALDFAATNDSAADKAGGEPEDKRKTAGSNGAEPEDKSADAAPPDETPAQRAARLAKRAQEQREVRVARSVDNSDRSASETLSVAESFDDIREEMVNNRIDSPEAQTRLKGQIADPLRHISTQLFPPYRASLVELRRAVDDPTAGRAKLETATKQADAILAEMKAVLDKMLELETFNEVVDMLRDIISTQEKLNEETQRKQKEDLKNKLKDLQD